MFNYFFRPWTALLPYRYTFLFQFQVLFKNNLKTIAKMSDENKKNWMMNSNRPRHLRRNLLRCTKASQSSPVSCKEAQEFKKIFKSYSRKNKKKEE
jgi:hypothetical protein